MRSTLRVGGLGRASHGRLSLNGMRNIHFAEEYSTIHFAEECSSTQECSFCSGDDSRGACAIENEKLSFVSGTIILVEEHSFIKGDLFRV